MKKIKNILKNNIKLFIGIIIGIIVAGTTAYATILYQSIDVGYNNTSSGLTSTTVQGALDELNTKADLWAPFSRQNADAYYAYGWPTKNSTKNYSTLNHRIFMRKLGNELSLCFLDYNSLICVNTCNPYSAYQIIDYNGYTRNEVSDNNLDYWFNSKDGKICCAFGIFDGVFTPRCWTREGVTPTEGIWSCCSCSDAYVDFHG